MALELSNGEPVGFDATLVNAGGLSGVVLFFISDNGAPFSMTRNAQAPMVSLTAYQPGPVVAAGHVVRAYIEWRDLHGELLFRSAVLQGNQP